MNKYKSLLHRSRLTNIAITGICIIALAASAFVVGGLAKRRGASKRQQETKRDTTKLPKIISKVPKLEIVSATIEQPGEPDAWLVLEIRNNSDLAVMAIDIISGDKMDYSGITKDGLDDPDNPTVIIEPHGTKTVKWSFGEILPNTTVSVSGVTYADGTEEGEKLALGAMHDQRAHSKAKRDAQKGAPR